MRWRLTVVAFCMLNTALLAQLSFGISSTYNAFDHETTLVDEDSNLTLLLPLNSNDNPKNGFALGIYSQFDFELIKQFGFVASIEAGRYSRNLTTRGKIPEQEGIYNNISLKTLYVRPSARLYYRFKLVDIFVGYSIYKYMNHKFDSEEGCFKLKGKYQFKNFYDLTHGPLVGAQIKIRKHSRILFKFNKIISPQIHLYGRGILGSFNSNNQFSLILMRELN